MHWVRLSAVGSHHPLVERCSAHHDGGEWSAAPSRSTAPGTGTKRARPPKNGRSSCVVPGDMSGAELVKIVERIVEGKLPNATEACGAGELFELRMMQSTSAECSAVVRQRNG